jgi:hypothetical protein
MNMFREFDEAFGCCGSVGLFGYEDVAGWRGPLDTEKVVVMDL